MIVGHRGMRGIRNSRSAHLYGQKVTVRPAGTHKGTHAERPKLGCGVPGDVAHDSGMMSPRCGPLRAFARTPPASVRRPPPRASRSSSIGHALSKASALASVTSAWCRAVGLGIPFSAAKMARNGGRRWRLNNGISIRLSRQNAMVSTALDGLVAEMSHEADCHQKCKPSFPAKQDGCAGLFNVPIPRLTWSSTRCLRRLLGQFCEARDARDCLL
jgi:hypothetical protein